jgi:hypothetical protein
MMEDGRPRPSQIVLKGLGFSRAASRMAAKEYSPRLKLWVRATERRSPVGERKIWEEHDLRAAKTAQPPQAVTFN